MYFTIYNYEQIDEISGRTSQKEHGNTFKAQSRDEIEHPLQNFHPEHVHSPNQNTCVSSEKMDTYSIDSMELSDSGHAVHEDKLFDSLEDIVINTEHISPVQPVKANFETRPADPTELLHDDPLTMSKHKVTKTLHYLI